MKVLTAERLREVLDYCHDTGVFTWKIRTSNRVKVGDVSGSVDIKGYIVIGVDGFLHKAHRLAWLHVNGSWPTEQIDHVNGSKSDNRISNLRIATNAQNCQNQRSAQSHNKTGLLGVSPKNGKFVAQIRNNGKKQYLGYFPTPEEAHAAYLEAKREFHSHCTI